MLDPQLLRSDIDAIAKRLATRPYALDVARFGMLEQQRKSVQTRTEELQAARNQLSKRIGAAKAKGQDAGALMQESTQANTDLAELAQRLQAIQAELSAFLLDVPNVP